MKRSSETEQKILQAASEVFLVKGHDGARMQEISDKAGINKALLHYYFRSKEKLFRTVFKKELRQMLEDVFSSISLSDSLKDFLQQFIHTYLKNISKRKNVMRFILWELNNSSTEIVDCFIEAFEKQGFEGNPLILKINQAIENGEIRPLHPAHLVLNVMGMSIFPFVAAPIVENIIPNFRINDPDFLVEREKAILDIIWNGIKVDTKY